MRVNRKQLKERLKKSASDALKQKLTKTEEKDVRKSGGETDVRMSPDDQYVSITKYIRGITLKRWDGAEREERLFKALGADDATQGGTLVPPQVSNQVIELLRQRAVIRSTLNPRVMTVPSNIMQVPRIDAGVEISWGGEGTQITEDTSFRTGQATMELNRMQCLVKLNQELLEFGSVDADPIVRADMADAIGAEEDKIICEGTGGTQPLGVYFNPRVQSTDLSAGISVDDLRDAIYQLRKENTKGVNGYAMNPRTQTDLAKLKDAQGRPVFGTGPGESMVANLWGDPIASTNEIAIDRRPSSDESYIIVADWRDLVIGEQAGIRIATTDTGGDAFEFNQVWIRAIRYIAVMLRHPESFVVIKGITS